MTDDPRSYEPVHALTAAQKTAIVELVRRGYTVDEVADAAGVASDQRAQLQRGFDYTVRTFDRYAQTLEHELAKRGGAHLVDQRETGWFDLERHARRRHVVLRRRGRAVTRRILAAHPAGEPTEGSPTR